MTILTSYTSGTYKAQIRSSLAGGFRQLYTATCTMGEMHAAHAVVNKSLGLAAAATVREVRDPAEIKALIGDFTSDPKRKQVFRIWTFDQKPSSQPAPSHAS